MKPEKNLEEQYEVMLAALWEMANGQQCTTIDAAKDLAKAALNLIGNPEPVTKWTRLDARQKPIKRARHNLIIDDSIKDELLSRLHREIDSASGGPSSAEGRSDLRNRLYDIVNEYAKAGLIEGTPVVELEVPAGYAFSHVPLDMMTVDFYSSTPTSSENERSTIR